MCFYFKNLGKKKTLCNEFDHPGKEKKDHDYHKRWKFVKQFSAMTVLEEKLQQTNEVLSS